MKKYKMICLIPLYGPIIAFFMIDYKLKKEGKITNKTTFLYLCLMAFLGGIGMLAGGLCAKLLHIEWEQNLFNLGGFISFVIVWILLIIPVMHYPKKI